MHLRVSVVKLCSNLAPNWARGSAPPPPDSRFHVCDPQADYRPRDPAESDLHGVVSEQLETFLERQRRRERLVPRFVERELPSFLECGVLAHGFVRVRCDARARDTIELRKICATASASACSRRTSS